MHCSSCGASVADGTAFCGACGRPIIGYSVGGAPGVPAGIPGAAVPYAAAPVAGAVVYAGFWLRVAAALIDGLVIGIPLGVLFFATIISIVPALIRMGQAANPMLVVGNPVAASALCAGCVRSRQLALLGGHGKLFLAGDAWQEGFGIVRDGPKRKSRDLWKNERPVFRRTRHRLLCGNLLSRELYPDSLHGEETSSA